MSNSSSSLILIKRSNISGITPKLSDLSLGELGLNTSDGNIFTVKTDSNGLSSIVTFLNSNQQPFISLQSLSSVKPQFGDNKVTQVFASVLGGYNNDITGAGSSVLNGEDNDIHGDFSVIGSGYKNRIYANGDYSFIAAGSGNEITHPNVFTLGSNLTSHAPNFTYVNNLSVQGSIYANGIDLLQNTGGSGNGNGIDNEVRSLTGFWDSTFTTVSSNSSIWNLVPISDPLKFKFIGDGTTQNYLVSGTNNSTNASYIDVYVENVKQEPLISYTLSADFVKFVDAPENGVEIVIITPNTKFFNIQDNNSYNIPIFIQGSGNLTWPLLAQGNLDMNGYSIVNVSNSSIVFSDGKILGSTDLDVWNETAQIVASNKDAWTNNDGKSAYEVWLLQGNSGSESVFLNSLRGEAGNDGLNGKSAYEVWLSQGNIGSESVFLNSLKGEAGNNGVDGVDGLNGQSAYELWLSQGNEGKTLNQFLSSLKGDTGDKGYDGYSAYDIWINSGNAGTEIDFLNSLKGDRGLTGDTVTNADSLTEGSNNLFYRSDRVIADSPVKTVAGRTGDITLGISDIADLTTTLNSKQASGNYVQLVNNLIPSIYLPGSVDEIDEYSNYHTLTSTLPIGQSGILYITLDNNKIYRWGETVYVEIIGSPGSTDSITEGASNKYFTTQRARDAAPVQSVANKVGNVLLEITDIQNLQPSLTSTNTTTAPITAKLSSNLGAYSNNSVIPANTPFEIILRNILTTIVPATYPIPTFSVNPSTASYEIGTNLNLNIVPTYTKNSAGEASQYRFKNGNNLLLSSSTATTFTSSVQLIANLTIGCEVSYLSGDQRYDNTGASSGTPPTSGTLTANSSYTIFRNNFYAADGTSTAVANSNDVRSGTATTSRSFTINITTGNKRAWFAFPSNLSNPNVVVTQRGFGVITSALTISTVSVAGANGYSPINYTVYSYLLPSGYLQNQFYDVTI